MFFAEIVKDTLEVEDVKIACVSAGFPSSQTFTEVKVAETAMALMEGADEIDIVISVGKFLSGDYESMCEEIQELKDVCKEHHMKVILETGALKSASNIMKASILSMYSGADLACGLSEVFFNNFCFCLSCHFCKCLQGCFFNAFYALKLF
jgi:deoxyribose-phosphate aldolase